MEDLIVQLEVIRIAAKQIHYSEHGESFYGNHLLMDEIAEPMIEFEDEIIESVILANTNTPPNLANIYSQIASKTLKNPSKNDLANQIKETIFFIEKLASKEGFQGDSDLLGRISNKLRKLFALLSRVIS